MRKTSTSYVIAATAVLLAAALNSYAQSSSPLADRIESGDRKAALELLAQSAPVNSAQTDGSTPLHWAVYRVDEELVETLLRFVVPIFVFQPNRRKPKQ